MPLFQFKAIDPLGKVAKGTEEAVSPESLIAALKTRGLFLMESQVEKNISTPQPHEIIRPAPVAISIARALKAKRSKISLETVSIFSTQFAIMLKTGIPIADALSSLGGQQTNPEFKTMLLDVTNNVQGGNSISESLARYPKVFDPVYISLVTAGENSGNMPLMLERISAYVEFQRELRTKIRSALLYPLLIVMTSGAVVTFLVLFILPTFATMFSDMSLNLPLPTRVLLGFSTHLRHWWFLYAAGIGGLCAFAVRWARNPLNLKPLHIFQLRLPVFGPLVRNIVMTRVLRTLGALVSSGVPILQALQLAGDSADNWVFHDLIGQIYRDASEGKGLSAAMYGNAHIPGQVAQMIENGEKTGTLPDVLNKIADFYEKETDTTLKNAFAVMEPGFVILLGGLVAGVAVSILLPVFQMNNANFG